MTPTFELDSEFLAREDVPLDAADLRYGFDRGFLDGAAVVRVATAAFDRIDDAVLRELAALLADELDRVPEVLDAAPVAGGDSERKWLYLQLKAAYLARDRLADPLAVVAELYADFGYPESVAPFVTYMPLAPGEEPGQEAMTRRWRQYLDAEHAALRAAGRP